MSQTDFDAALWRAWTQDQLKRQPRGECPAMSDHELMPAIIFMGQKVDEAERKVKELLDALNVLRAEAGLPPRSLSAISATAQLSYPLLRQ